MIQFNENNETIENENKGKSEIIIIDKENGGVSSARNSFEDAVTYYNSDKQVSQES